MDGGGGKEDPAGVGAWWQEYGPKVQHYIALRTDNEVAEDLTAQTFARALEAMTAGRGPRSSQSGWLFRIAHNLVIDHYRLRERRPTVDLDGLAETHSGGSTPHEEAERASLREWLMRGLRTLTDEQGQVLQMRLAGYEFEEIAAVMGRTIGAVKALQHRAMVALRERLARIQV